MTIRRKRSEPRAQSGAKSEAILKNFGKEPLSAAELAVALGFQSKTGAFKRTLQKLVDSDLILRGSFMYRPRIWKNILSATTYFGYGMLERC
jgi:hypothetical protein